MKAISIKTLLAAFAVAAALAAALPAPAAKADVSVGIGLGIYPPVTADWNGGYDGGYGGGYGNGYEGGYEGGYGGGYGGGYEGGYHPRPPVYSGYVSCRDGRRILWHRGYSGIEVQSCRQGFYRYSAWRNGRHYLMAVDAQGDVTRLRQNY